MTTYADIANTECVLWTGAKTGRGYGVVSFNGRQVYAHRVAYERVHGKIPDGLVIAHKCDMPACVNPDHLFACTQKENLFDMRMKGRAPYGDRHWSRKRPELVKRGEEISQSKLTAAKVAEIRSLYERSTAGRATDTSLAGLARKFGVNFQTIHKIVSRKSWKHL